MGVQSEIDRIITAVGNAYSKVSEKGGTVPASQTVANLATAIDSILTVPSTTSLIKGNGSGGLVAATRGSDYIASDNIVKQTLVATETTPTENYAINWVYG
ncbi:MAG TPA: hypothetical protein VFD34_02110 [Clostridia bacterium]|nr:hypothetical protein [Clostridia bacterium]